MKARLLALLKAHWPILAALVLGLGIGWVAHRPQPTVTLDQKDKALAARSKTGESHKEQGPLDAKIVVGASPCVAAQGTAPQPAPSRRARQRPPQTIAEAIASLPPGSTVELHQGASVEEKKTSDQTIATREAHTEMKESPTAVPRAIFFAGPQLRPDTRVALGAAARLVGPTWGQVVLVPDLSDPLKKSSVILMGGIAFH